MKHRVVGGDEREKLLQSRKPAGFDFTPYTSILEGANDGDVVAVETGPKGQRGEKIRFSRAARKVGKSLQWLTPVDPNEIAFQISGPRQHRGRRGRALVGDDIN